MAKNSTAVIEHPVFFNMESLSDNPELEARILQGLNDLVHHEHSDLFFLFSGRVLESKGVPFTHALISRFPSVQALRTYYDKAILDVASLMIPVLKNEFCVDYVVEMEESAIKFDVKKESAAHATFIKLKSNVSDADVKGAMDAFLALAQESGCAVQLTCGENLYIREYYRATSHSFVAYFASSEDMKKWQQDASVVSVLQDKILPLADSFATVSLVPYDQHGQ